MQAGGLSERSVNRRANVTKANPRHGAGPTPAPEQGSRNPCEPQVRHKTTCVLAVDIDPGLPREVGGSQAVWKLRRPAGTCPARRPCGGDHCRNPAGATAAGGAKDAAGFIGQGNSRRRRRRPTGLVVYNRI